VDDIEGTMREFISPGLIQTFDKPPLNLTRVGIGYGQDETAFLDLVEEDSTSFKPLGENIYSYTRQSPSAPSKGKGIATAESLNPTSEDVIEYEVYRVSYLRYF
jgi:Histone acetyl transferase HAT1 N-terminus